MANGPVAGEASSPSKPATLSGAESLRATRLWFVALIACTSLMSFYCLQGGADFEPTDAWVAQTAREMSESKDWRGYVVPMFSGEVRMQKSPGPYWAVCLTAALRGTPVDVSSVRIPNGIAAIILVATIFWLALRIAGQRAAIFSGFVAASSAMVLYWSHRGASDLFVATFCTLSLACLWIGSEIAPAGRKRVALWLFGYFAAGLGMLYKFPVPLLAVGVPAVLYIVCYKRWEILRSAWHLVGLLLFMLPWAPWVIALASLQSIADADSSSVDFVTTLNKWRVEFWDRVTGDLPNVEGQRSDWRLYLLYVGVAFAFAAPWCLSIPQAIARSFRSAENVNQRGIWFLLLWLAGLFVALEIQAGKETRYFLIAMPPLLILLGIEIAHFFSPARRVDPLLDRAGLLATLVLSPAAWIAGGYFIFRTCRNLGPYADYSWAEIRTPFIITAAIFSCGTLITALLYLARRENFAFGTLVATMFGAWLYAWPNLLPLLAGERPFISFAHQLRDRIPPELRPRILQVAQQDSRIIWHSDVRIRRVVDQLKLLKMQGGYRTRAREIRIVAEEMIRLLRSDDLVLFVSDPTSYAAFLIGAPAELEARGEVMPQTHLWLAGEVGRPDHRYVLFGNRAPPWPAPAFGLPRKMIAEILRQLALPQSAASDALTLQREGRADEPPGGERDAASSEPTSRPAED